VSGSACSKKRIAGPRRVGVGAGVAQPIRMGPAPAQLQAWPWCHSIVSPFGDIGASIVVGDHAEEPTASVGGHARIVHRALSL
jgi:hypothetical protein